MPGHHNFDSEHSKIMDCTEALSLRMNCSHPSVSKTPAHMQLLLLKFC